MVSSAAAFLFCLSLLGAACFSNAFAPLPPSSACQLPQPQCPETPSFPSQQPFAAFRTDVWIQDKYKEPLPEPTSGGRLQLLYAAAADVSEADISAGKFFVNGNLVSFTIGADMSIVHWARVEVAADRRLIFLSLHSNNSQAFTIGQSLTLEISGGSGSVVLNATFILPPPTPLIITYITTSNNGSTLIAHIQSAASSAPAISSVFVNSINVTSRICLPSPSSIPQGDSHILEVPLCAPSLVGDVLSLLLLLSDGSHVAAAVRRVKETMHVSVWPKSDVCPLPKLDDATAEILTDIGISSAYVYPHTAAKACGSKKSTENYINDVLPSTGFHVMISDDFLSSHSKGQLTDTSHVLSMMIADEDDTPKYPTSDLQQKLSLVLSARTAPLLCLITHP
jgi:hypothetical protein